MPTWRCVSIGAEYFKSNAYITHFLGKYILLQSIFIHSIGSDCMFHRVGDFKAIFVAHFTNLRVHGWKNDVSLSQDIRDPPRKGRFLTNVKWCKSCCTQTWAIGPLNQKFPSQSACQLSWLPPLNVYDAQYDTVGSWKRCQHPIPWRCLKQSYSQSIFL